MISDAPAAAPTDHDAAAGPRPDPDAVGPVVAVDLLLDEAREAVAQHRALAAAYLAAAAVTARTVTSGAVIALLFAFVALLTLAIGTMLALAAHVGMVLAALIVTLALAIIAGVAGWVAARAFRRFRRAAAGEIAR